MGIKSDAFNMADRKHMTNTSDFAGDPYAHLATAIIIKAFEDLEIMADEEKHYFEGSPVTKEGLLNFFGSKWCEALLSFQNNVTQNDLMQAVLKICK